MFQIQISRLTPELLHMAAVGAPEKAALISIMDHKRDCAQRHPSLRVLRLCFDDAAEAGF